MKSKITVRQQLHLVPQIFRTVLIAVVVLFIMSGSLVAQAKLPFVGTRTFCFGGDIGGDDRIRAIVTITATGVTTLKTNAYNSAGWGGDSPTYRYENFSGKKDRKGVVYREPRVPLLEVSSGTAIRIFTEQDWMEGTLCNSSEVLPKETVAVKPTSVAAAKKGSIAKKSTPQSTKTTTTLEQIVAPFALPIDSPDKEPGWKSADEAVGVRWDYRNPPRNGEYGRSGPANLRGHGVVDVSFSGSKTTVSEIEVVIGHLYSFNLLWEPNEHLKVLRAQFGDKVSIHSLNKCSEEFDVYEIVLEGKRPIYVEISASAGTNGVGGNLTFLFFQRNEKIEKCDPSNNPTH